MVRERLNANIMSACALVPKRIGKRARMGALETVRKRVEDVLERRNGEGRSCKVTFGLSEMKIYGRVLNKVVTRSSLHIRRNILSSRF